MFKSVRDEMLSIHIPVEYAGIFDFILPGLDVSRKVIVSESGIPSGTSTELQTRFFDFAGVARFSACRTGEDFAEVLTMAEREAENRGIQVVQVYLNLGEAWSGRAISGLRQKGYFFGGFLPRWFDTDGMLMQKLVALPNFDSIKLFSRRAKDLLDLIRGIFLVDVGYARLYRAHPTTDGRSQLEYVTGFMKRTTKISGAGADFRFIDASLVSISFTSS